jgi:DNA-binding FadR family transcriptional regulator
MKETIIDKVEHIMRKERTAKTAKQLQIELSASRSAVRSAVMLLEADGTIKQVPYNKGRKGERAWQIEKEIRD